MGYRIQESPVPCRRKIINVQCVQDVFPWYGCATSSSGTMRRHGNLEPWSGPCLFGGALLWQRDPIGMDRRCLRSHLAPLS